jgi:peptidoglycan/xylan/chitin deacetylase (PgdA/CDA1 family)
MWYWIKTPLIVKKIFPNQIWSISSNKNSVYLTFDDGPTPDVTENILKILNAYGAKATFFCIGSNVKEHPDLYKKITSSGNSIGNHSMTHPMGWGKSKKVYLNDVHEAEKLINSNLFRPPYGKINFKSNKTLQQKYKIIMWDVVGGDFDEKCSKEKLISNISENTESGSIVVLHDNVKVKDKMLTALPQIIEKLQSRGFILKAIPFNPLR